MKIHTGVFKKNATATHHTFCLAVRGSRFPTRVSSSAHSHESYLTVGSAASSKLLYRFSSSSMRGVLAEQLLRHSALPFLSISQRPSPHIPLALSLQFQLDAWRAWQRGRSVASICSSARELQFFNQDFTRRLSSSLTCLLAQPNMWRNVRNRLVHRPHHLALPHPRKARGRRSIAFGRQIPGGKCTSGNNENTKGTFTGYTVEPLNGTFLGTLTSSLYGADVVTVSFTQNPDYTLSVTGTSVENGLTTAFTTLAHPRLSDANPDTFRWASRFESNDP